MSEGERFVDLVREGFDCVVRGGALPDSDMVVRRLGVMHEVTCASPAYLAGHGALSTPEDLDGHMMVSFVSSRTGQVMPLDFARGGTAIEVTLPTRVLFNGADAYAAAARLGFGLVQAARHRVADDLAAGTLVEVLADFPPTPTPIAVLYPSSRQLSRRVRVFVDWLVEVLGPLTRPEDQERPNPVSD